MSGASSYRCSAAQRRDPEDVMCLNGVMAAASTSRIPGCERSVAGRQSHRPHAVRGRHHRQRLAMLKTTNTRLLFLDV
jgi:hypothetical protein